MFRTLILKNFVKHKNAKFDFEEGFIVIKGANGAGKSLLAEAIGFALFGQSALRGKKDEYDANLEVTLEVEIKNAIYTIKRTMNDCSINGVDCVGTTACNKFLARLLGYSQDLYNFANFSKQNDLTKFTDVAPAERKRLVDELVGAENVNKEIKKVRSQINTADALKSSLDVQEPEKPKAPFEDCAKEEADCRKKLYELSKFSDRNFDAELDKEYTEDLDKEQVSVFKQIGSLESELNRLSAEERNLTLGQVPDIDFDVEEEKIKTYVPYPSVPYPEFTEEELSIELEKITVHEFWEKGDFHTCPKCGETFKDSGEEPEVSKLTRQQIQEQKQRIKAWAGLNKDLPKMDKPIYTLSDITRFRKIKQDSSRKEEITKEKETIVKVLGELLDKKERLSKIIENHTKKEVSTYDEAELRSRLNLCTEYEADKIKYETLYERYKKNKELEKGFEEEIDTKTNLLKALVSFKEKIKTYVIPSLERVASSLIYEMSNGELSCFKISDDFDITLDGKRTILLSGSEKALANIALRIALGRVLTKGVLNIFIADEIDAAMSIERSELVYESLRKLKGKLKQVVVITHKDIIGELEIEI